ncbi:CRISPR-associated protein Cse2 [Candidatus Nitrosoglobus terrae]|uniref:CRISPR-associated protein Cse2 n=1 Tax=Candidatus Nitrosoglobus terrae TaxID=1630141 RepID=A0A1Q2SPL8_9GAMM|nr:type I-E CRISPR-associated protein Cse2/CasB [Candidatus Nitrosoglobus terrae]BAW81084.1 CRISPR-associated protein Cse2 [Candidatus Nitrosoglobus terrae]
METVASDRPASREENFVSYLLTRIQQDKGLAARLRRADNPATEYQSWEFLAGFGVDLEQEYQRLPFITVAAALAKARAERNGNFRLGQAIAACYTDDNQSDQAKAKLRRVLACDGLPELCRILRPVLTLIESRVTQPLDYVRLLRQLQYFAPHGQQIKAQWAQEFYGRQTEADAPAEGAP